MKKIEVELYLDPYQQELYYYAKQLVIHLEALAKAKEVSDKQPAEVIYLTGRLKIHLNE